MLASGGNGRLVVIDAGRHSALMSATATTAPSSRITTIPAAAPAVAIAHLAALLAVETDCSDVHDALARGVSDVVVLDVRGPEAFAAGHLPGAVHLPYKSIDADALAAWPEGTTFVTYCAGPHCNAADQAGLRVAQAGRPVKKMLGGISGWLDEGFALEGAGEAPGDVTGAVAC